MSVLAVAKKDLKSTSRSRGLWAVAILLALLFALIAYSFGGGFSQAKPVQQLFSILTVVLSLLLPIIGLVVSYMAITGERESGGVKFLLSFPNTRRDVFLGKLGSRLIVVGAGVLFMFGTAASVAVWKHGVLPIQVVVGMFVLSVIYGSVFVSIAIALSGAVATRSRAIGAAIGSYFILVILYVVPGIRLTAIVRWLHTTILGFTPNPDLYNAITYISPYIAFQKATNLVLPPVLESQIFRQNAETGAGLPVYLSDEFSLVIFAIWLVVPLFFGYLRFQRSDLQ